MGKFIKGDVVVVLSFSDLSNSKDLLWFWLLEGEDLILSQITSKNIFDFTLLK